MVFNDDEHEEIFKEEIKHLLGKSISQDYVEQIFENIYKDVKEDVELRADHEGFSAADCQKAIGRVLISHLGMIPF